MEGDKEGDFYDVKYLTMMGFSRVPASDGGTMEELSKALIPSSAASISSPRLPNSFSFSVGIFTSMSFDSSFFEFQKKSRDKRGAATFLKEGATDLVVMTANFLSILRRGDFLLIVELC